MSETNQTLESRDSSPYELDENLNIRRKHRSPEEIEDARKREKPTPECECRSAFSFVGQASWGLNERFSCHFEGCIEKFKHEKDLTEITLEFNRVRAAFRDSERDRDDLETKILELRDHLRRIYKRFRMARQYMALVGQQLAMHGEGYDDEEPDRYVESD
ncbi:hypothetical protein H0H81_003846 [Sphagnurus paluster]|uniref:Uncharacterized protein n=1 Tax=Sphagnurus paluster TaxID=117069 RepID=A0A9P7GMX6_9AGAR|nr:hypothetical protein H0H81_003846 [Sphagnurus paluster]